MDSRIVAVGGHDGRIRHNTVEEYDPVANQWTSLPLMNSARSDLAVVVYRHM